MSDAKELKPLSKKHQRFVAEYLKCFNGTRAYMVVYPNASYETARANASDLLAKTNILAMIDAQKNSVLMQADEALKLQTDIAQGDMGDFYDDNLVLDFREARAQGLTRLVKKIKQKTTTYIAKKPSEEDREITEIELELYPADTAQERILKIHGRFAPEKIDLSNSDGSLKPETMSPSEILARADALRKQIKDANGN